MFSGLTTGLMNGLKSFCGINNTAPKSDIPHYNIFDQNIQNTKILDQFILKHKYIFGQNLKDTNNYDNYVEQEVQDTKNDDSMNSWKNLIIPETCSYSQMGRPFYDVLYTYEYIDENREISKCFVDDEFNVTIKHCNKVHQNTPNSWEVEIESRSKILNMFRPYTVVGEERQFGLKFEPNYNISGDIGIRQISCNDHISSNTLYTSAQFTLPAMVMDAELELSRDVHTQATLCKMQMSPVFGHRFNNLGFMVGFNFKLNNSPDFELKNICEGVTFGLVSPVAAGRFTIKPNDTECEVDAYWKVNKKLEVAGSFKSHLRHPEWRPHDQEIGMKYKCSDQMSYGLKTDLTGNIWAGLSLIGKWMKINFCFQPKTMLDGEMNKVGFSLEF